MIVFEELGHGGCRWPIADCGLPGEKGEFLFCGEAVADKVAPYCAGHMTAAYKRPRVRAAIVVKTREVELACERP